MATIWAQITAIVSAEPGVFALNLALLVCEGIAAGAVAAGIVWESAAANTWKRRVSHKLVIWGVVAEVAFSLALFISDEIVSGSQLLEIKEQQSKIIALETRLSPRRLSGESMDRIVLELRKFGPVEFALSVDINGGDQIGIAQEIGLCLEGAGWKPVNWFDGSFVAYGPHTTKIGKAFSLGDVEISGVSGKTNEAAKALVDALNTDGIKATLVSPPVLTEFPGVKIMIGERT